MKNEIISMLNEMNDVQLEHVLDYVTNEYDEEGFESKALDMIVELTKENAVLALKQALQKRSDFPTESIKIVEEESEKYIRSIKKPKQR